jgi:hypothetical protein
MANSREAFEKLSKLAAKCRQSALQPRLAMGMAMTLFSFAMLKQTHPAPFNPIGLWRGAEGKVICAKDRAVEHYENIRLVYRLERQLQRETASRPNKRLN